MKSRQFRLVKLRTWNGKTISTPRKINAILLNIKINPPKSVNMCGYKLATKRPNFKEMYLAWVKILQKVLGRSYFFDSRCMSVHTVCQCNMNLRLGMKWCLQIGQLLDKVDRQEALMQHATRSLTDLHLVAVYKFTFILEFNFNLANFHCCTYL